VYDDVKKPTGKNKIKFLLSEGDGIGGAKNKNKSPLNAYVSLSRHFPEGRGNTATKIDIPKYIGSVRTMVISR